MRASASAKLKGDRAGKQRAEPMEKAKRRGGCVVDKAQSFINKRVCVPRGEGKALVAVARHRHLAVAKGAAGVGDQRSLHAGGQREIREEGVDVSGSKKRYYNLF